MVRDGDGYLVLAILVFLLVSVVFIGALFGLGNRNNKDLIPEGTSASVETVVQIEKVYVPVVETQIVTEIVDRVIPVEPEDYIPLLAIAREYEELVWMHESYMADISEKYPVATVVWAFLTDGLGLNNYVAAGIMGNLMNECGGNTLTLYPTVYGLNREYYGICQWALVYNPQIKDGSLEDQLAVRGSTIETAFNKYGSLYKKGFTYADFCALEDCHAASNAFCMVYERPGSASLTTRRNNAAYAYSVFVREYGR